MSSPVSADPQLEMEASEWLIRLLDCDPEPDDPDFDTVARSASFKEWIERSTEHEDTFIRVCKAYQKTSLLNHSAPPRPSFRERVPVRALLAAAVSALVLSYWLLHKEVPEVPEYPTTSGAFSTQLGEHRCDRLPDGSSVCLNSHSEVRYTFTGSSRSTELVSGEACFTVVHQNQPFDVRSGGIVVRDVSTSFDVYRKRNSTLITVVQGSIDIAPVGNSSNLSSRPVRFHKSQQVEFVDGGRNLYMRKQLTDNDLAQLLAWKEGRIDLTGRTLSEALEEFGRYQSIKIFKFTDPGIANLRVGGDMEFGNLDDFLQALEREFGLRHTISGSGADTVVTLTRASAPAEKPHGIK